MGILFIGRKKFFLLVQSGTDKCVLTHCQQKPILFSRLVGVMRNKGQPASAGSEGSDKSSGSSPQPPEGGEVVEKRDRDRGRGMGTSPLPRIDSSGSEGLQGNQRSRQGSPQK